MTIEEIITKYDKKIRRVIGCRCDNDVLEDRYQDCIMTIMNKLDIINAHPNPVGYIITVAKRCAQTSKKSNKKLLTYGGWTNDDDEDTTEEWLLEDDSFNPEKVLESRHELKQRKRSEDWAVVCKKDVISTTKNIFSISKDKKFFNVLQRGSFYVRRQRPQYYESMNLLKKLAKHIGIHDMSVQNLCGIRASLPINIKSVLYAPSNNLGNFGRRNQSYIKYLQKRSEYEKSK